MIHNFLLNTEDYVGANHIYEPSKPLLRGGMKLRINPDERVLRVLLSTDILLHQKDIEIYFDFFI